MGCDHPPNTVGIDNTGKKYEGNEVVVQNVGLQVQIGDYQSPNAEER